jgi:hypothetical protein
MSGHRYPVSVSSSYARPKRRLGPLSSENGTVDRQVIA